MKPVPSQGILSEWLDYNPETGVFLWRKYPGGSAKLGSPAGGLDDEGYWIIRLLKQQYKAHRIAWVMVYGEQPTCVIDHINGIKDDNRIENLRAATLSGNRRNGKIHRDNKSGYKGVCWEPRVKGRPWKATIRFEGRSISLGYFADPYEAHLAYCAAAKKYFGEFARFA